MSSPSEEQIAAWKREYKNIYSIPFRGVDYIFREISFREYDDAINHERANDSASAEEFLVDIALLSPVGQAYDDTPAGVITSLAEEILEYSGFGAPRHAKEVLDRHRDEVNNVHGLMKAFVLASMPSYKEEELDELTFNQLAAKVALSEKVMEVNQASVGIEGISVKLDLIDPEEEAVREETQREKHTAQKKPGQAGYDDPIAAKLQNALG